MPPDPICPWWIQKAIAKWHRYGKAVKFACWWALLMLWSLIMYLVGAMIGERAGNKK